jgi:pyridoxine kinase
VLCVQSNVYLVVQYSELCKVKCSLWYSGYIGSVSFLNTVLQVAEKLRSVNPDLIYGNHFSPFIICMVIFFCTKICRGKCHTKNTPSYWLKPVLCAVCDPVLGDEGKLYVPQELISVYQQKVTAYFNLLTLSCAT